MLITETFGFKDFLKLFLNQCNIFYIYQLDYSLSILVRDVRHGRSPRQFNAIEIDSK